MIRNDKEVLVALEWIAYWKGTRTVGQSWLGNEQAARTISELRREIDEYRRQATPPSAEPEVQVRQQPV